MKATASLLDRARKALDLTSDDALAHALNWPRSTVACYRIGRTSMDVVKIREFSRVTGISLDEVIDAAVADKVAKAKNRRTVTSKAA